MIVFAIGLGFTFMPLTLAAVSQIDEGDTGIASGVLNTTQQIGGSIGLALLTTVATTVFTSELNEGGGHLLPGQVGSPPIKQCSGRRVDRRVPGVCRAGAVAFFITLFAIKVTKDESADVAPWRPPSRLLVLRLRLVHVRRRKRSPTQPSRLPPLSRAVVRILVLGSMDQCVIASWTSCAAFLRFAAASIGSPTKTWMGTPRCLRLDRSS